MTTSSNSILDVETRTFQIERRVIQYQPEKFDELGPYLYRNCSVVINWAGPEDHTQEQNWIHFRNRGDHKETFVKPGEFLVIDENGRVTAHVTDRDFPKS